MIQGEREPVTGDGLMRGGQPRGQRQSGRGAELLADGQLIEVRSLEARRLHQPRSLDRYPIDVSLGDTREPIIDSCLENRPRRPRISARSRRGPGSGFSMPPRTYSAVRDTRVPGSATWPTRPG